MTPGHVLLSLVVGALFGLTLSTKYPLPAAALSSLAAAAFILAVWRRYGQSERARASPRPLRRQP